MQVNNCTLCKRRAEQLQTIILISRCVYLLCHNGRNAGSFPNAISGQQNAE